MTAIQISKLERVLKALANRRRLAILQYLKHNSGASVGEIAEAIKLSFKATSKHLGVLKSADLVEFEQNSLQFNYRLSHGQDPTVQSLLKRL